ncbi:jg3310 [Pararge aegeria aegeria]|uniref:Jg3310 protein n=1 Tax=Pararge aegeria aegeria TaxID=348720 RepID=A0A8S4RWC7_9NEOP|nr:jg3310 [Pararge aegeria aegeria]
MSGERARGRERMGTRTLPSEGRARTRARVGWSRGRARSLSGGNARRGHGARQAAATRALPARPRLPLTSAHAPRPRTRPAAPHRPPSGELISRIPVADEIYDSFYTVSCMF